MSSTKLNRIGSANFGQRLRQIRGILSQEEFGKKVGATRKQIADYESERTDPSSEFLVSVCSILSVDLNWLLTGMNESEVEKRFARMVDLSKEKQPTDEEHEILAILRTLGITNRIDFHMYFDYARAVQEKVDRDKRKLNGRVKTLKAAESTAKYGKHKRGK